MSEYIYIHFLINLKNKLFLDYITVTLIVVLMFIAVCLKGNGEGKKLCTI